MIRYLAWAWLILVGVLLITPIGPVCIACGGETTLDYVLGAVSILLGVVNIAMGMQSRAG